MEKTIIWTHQADAELNEAFLDLLENQDLLKQLQESLRKFMNPASILAISPEIYKLDTLKEKNKGNIRTYEKHTFRISYLTEEDFVYIIRVRYARKEPLEY